MLHIPLILLSLSCTFPSATALTKSWAAPTIGSLSSFGHILKIAFGNGNKEFVPSPSGDAGSVIKIKYPAGSYKPSATPIGGFGFYADPLDLRPAKSVNLTFEVFFPIGFNFVKGGKLPGLFGGHDSCAGGYKATDCFSSRYMFRSDGIGEMYLYVDPSKQVPQYCQIPPYSICNADFGDSIGRGSFRFATGKWNKLTQIITLNDLGQANGKLRLLFNGQQVIYFDKMIWQGNASIPFIGLDFTTFFGGSDLSWATPKTQYSYFRKFSISSST